MPKLPKGRGREKPIDSNKSWGGDTSFYRTTKWRKLRGYVLRQNPLCVHCEEKGIATAAEVVDHITPIKKGGAELELSNLQGLCHKCHNRKTYYENNPHHKIPK